MTLNPVSGTPRRMPKPRLPDVMTIRFDEGTFDRIDAVAGKFRRSEFIREHIEAAIAKAERAKRKASQPQD